LAQSDQREPPVAALVTNLVGVLMVAAGFTALVVPEIGERVPALADAPTAWTLIGAGLALDFWSIPAIIRGLRNR
jgi:hypothetical protein